VAGITRFAGQVLTTEIGQLDHRALSRILDVTRQLGEPIDLDTMLAQVIDAARDVLDADRGTVFLFDEQTNELYAKVATGAKEIRFPADRGIAGECAQSRRVLNIPDCYADDRFNREIDQRTGYRTRCLLTAPLIGTRDRLVGVMQVLNKHAGVFDERDENIATALAAQCAVALQRATLIEAQLVKEKLERDLQLARDIQQRFLPERMPEIAGYDLSGWSRPADETGGDTFDVAVIDRYSTMLLMGDATGHGIGPALSVTQVRSMMRMAIRLGAPLEAIFNNINDQLADDLAGNRFVTAFFGVLDVRNHTVSYCSGGQAPILRYRAAAGACDNLEATTMPMGIMPGVNGAPAEPVVLHRGDVLALISDGIYEAMDPRGEQFGEPRVMQCLAAHHALPMAELSRRLVETVKQFTQGGPQADDMTIVLVRRLP